MFYPKKMCGFGKNRKNFRNNSGRRNGNVEYCQVCCIDCPRMKRLIYTSFLDYLEFDGAFERFVELSTSKRD